MKKTKVLSFIFALLLSVMSSNGQTCTSPITVAVNSGFMGVDSFANSSTRFLKFTADDFRTKIKLFIKNYNPSTNVVNVYNNDCANLAANKLNQPGIDPRVDSFPIQVNGDSIEITSTNFRSGSQYLIEIGISSSNPSTYTKYNISVITSPAFWGCPLIVSGCPSYTCDLVCNGGFEDIGSSLPVSYFSQLSKAVGWDQASAGTPDLYSSGSTFADCGMPCNVDGNRAHITTTCTTRNNYALIINGWDPTVNQTYNEYIETRLKSPMVNGQSYVISLYVSKVDNCNASLNKLSYWLTSAAINHTGLQTAIPNTPSGTFTNTSILNSTSWNKISFCYTASGGEEYLTIGMPSGPGAWNNGANISVSNCATFTNPTPVAVTGMTHNMYIDEVSVKAFEMNAGANQTVAPCGNVTLSGSAVSCNTITLGSMTYNWSGPGLNSANQTTVVSVTGTGTTNFNFYASGIADDGSTCQDWSTTSVISVTPNPLVITPSNASVCPGTNVTLTASGGVGTYTWLPGNSNNNPEVFTVNGNTTYTVIGATSGGCTITQTITIYTYTDVISVSSNTSAICIGNTATLSASGGSGFTWQPGSLSGSPVNVSPTSTTIYTVTGTTTANSCVKTNTISLTVYNLPTISISPASSNTICINDIIILTASGASTYTWLPSTVSSTISLSPATATTYTINGTSSVGCVNTQTAEINVNSLPTVNCSTSNTMVCQGSSATLTATGTHTYTWFPGGPGASIVVTPPALASVNYTVIGTNTLTGCTNSCVVTQSVFLSGTPFFTVTATPSVVCNSAPATTLSATGSPNSYTWMPGTIVSSTLAVSTATALSTTYSVASTNSLGCFGKQTFTVTGTDAVAQFASFPVICGIQPLDLASYISPTVSAGTYSVNGTQITGSTYTFSSAGGATYTVGYTYTAGIYCNNTATAVITSNSACCTSSLSQITSSVLSGATINGGQVINQDITITGTSTFQNGEFLMAPGVKITVASGQELHLKGAHLYACQTTMWKGIEIQADADITSAPSSTTGMSTFIEDAEIAINVLPITATYTNHPMPIEIHNTIFNKNYIAININTVTISSELPMQFYSNVITCRTLTFTGTGVASTWPTTGTVVATQDLRAAINPTTGLTAPYTLQGATTTTILAPYGGLFSYAGFQLTNVANAGYGTEIGESGQTTDPTDFNLFDGLSYGIASENSNLSVINNVFQNSRKRRNVGADGIYYTVTNDYFYKLNLTNTISSYSATPDVGNRFWDCNFGVEASKVYNFNMQYNTIRSTQSNSGGSGALPGNTGIYLTTNRFGFYIRNNEFTNIKFPINIPIVSSTYDAGAGTVTGIYANNLGILYNTFNRITPTGSFTTEYVNTAVTITSPNSANWVRQTNTGVSVVNNMIKDVYRGITISGINSYSTAVKENTISLVNDVMSPSAAARGIEISNTTNTLSGNVIVHTNTLSAINNTNTAITLVYAGNNSGTSSPSVTCNDLTKGYKGFDFNASNSSTIWKGNKMTDQARGLVLSNNGIIGTQGGSTAPIDNEWLGTTWTGTVHSTYTEGTTTDAANSKLYTRTGYPWQAINNNGNNSNTLWYSWGTNTISASGSFNCGGGGGGEDGRYANNGSGRNYGSLTQNSMYLMRTTGSNAELDENTKYIADLNQYRIFDANDSLRNSDSSNVNFYNNLTNTSIGKYIQADKYIYEGQLGSAMVLRATITPTNNVETNYNKFYDLYYHYKQNNLSDQDISDLEALANLCPGIDGAIVYNARALYNIVTQSPMMFIENCSGETTNERKQIQSTTAPTAYTWDVNLFPNPTSGELNVLSRSDNESLELTIRDVSGKVVGKRNLAISGFFGKLDLDLANGVYFITISKPNNESITKKLVITK